jgi:hypothetical protein
MIPRRILVLIGVLSPLVQFTAPWGDAERVLEGE